MIEAIRYDHQYSIKAQSKHACVEDAMQWAAAQWNDQNIEWGDTQIGLCGYNKPHNEAITAGTPYPIEGHEIIEIHGVEENGEARELEEGDWRDQ